jgi:hypothetical protein
VPTARSPFSFFTVVVRRTKASFAGSKAKIVALPPA